MWIAAALLVALLALGWPQIEQQLAASGVQCPAIIKTLFHPTTKVSVESADGEASETSELRTFTLEELRKYDGTDESLPILLAIGGKVVDVTTGAKFYGPGKMYHQFAGTACTRALTLSSLDPADISDDLTGLSEEKLQEMEETKRFYYDKYPVVGVLANN